MKLSLKTSAIKSFGKTDENDIKSLEKVLNIRFPNDYKDFLLKTNGGSIPNDNTNEIVLKNIGKIINIDILYGVNTENSCFDIEYWTKKYIDDTFYCSSFILNTSIQFLFIAIIIHMLALAIIRMPDYNYTDMICRKDLGVMEYMSCPEAAKKWGISERRVQVLCRENRILGVSKLGYMWLIPKDAEKPIDGRTKQGKELHHE